MFLFKRNINDSLIIIFAAYPKFTKEPNNVTVEASSTVRLDCAVDGDPKPQIYWQFNFGNDFPAARERRMLVKPQDDAFFIVNTKATDQGVYTCTAENPAGKIRANATVQVCMYSIIISISIILSLFFSVIK